MKVLIIGAGPSGSAAAIALRRGGVGCVLVVATETLRPKPGESLPPAIEPLFEQLGLGKELREANFARYSGIWVRWAQPLAFRPFGTDHRGQWQGFHGPRMEFDQLLLRQAQSLGTEVHMGCMATDVQWSQDKQAFKVHTTKGIFSTNFILDASGGWHWLTRKLNGIIHKRSPQLIAR